MEQLWKLGGTLRTHKKKSVVFSVAGVYGLRWWQSRQQDQTFMAGLAREAQTYGQQPVRGAEPAYRVTVVLNPVAGGGQGRKLYEKHCAPLLHLAGMKVSVVRTESEGQAKDILELVDDADAVLVAGGDGTLMEAVTGLLRRKDRLTATKVPLGVLPVGKTNTLARSLFEVDSQSKVTLLGEATMGVVRQLMRPASVVEVENRSEDEARRGKRLYCMNRLELGAWRDARARQDTYWLFPFGLKRYVTYLGSYLLGHQNCTWDCDIDIQYLGPEDKTEQKPQDKKTGNSQWFSWFSRGDGNKPVNASDQVVAGSEERWTDLGRFHGTQLTVERSEDSLATLLYPGPLSLEEFVQHGWSAVEGSRWESSVTPQQLQASQLYLVPGEVGTEKVMALDGDPVELSGPVLVRLLRDQLTLFCGRSQSSNRSSPAPQPAPASRWGVGNIQSSLVRRV